MTGAIFLEIHQNLPREGPGRNEYTRKAFEMLPKSGNPRILDIGCGTGGPTLELARLSKGEVLGVDIHQPYLDELTKKAERAGLSDHVKAMKCSMFKMDFPDESFDIIWAEGSIFIIGFERGLKDWRRFLKPNGSLVVHEMAWLRPDPPQEIHDYLKQLYPGIKTVPENLEQITGCDYNLIGHFRLPEDAWWVEYYGPLEARIHELRKKYIGDSGALEILDKEQLEINMYKKYHAWYGSAFFAMQKGNNDTLAA